MKHIPEGLTFEALTDEQKRVLAYAYRRYDMACQTMRMPRVADRILVAFFEPQSEGQVVEQELWELGLLARTPAKSGDNVQYGYAISYDGVPFVGIV